MVVHSDARADAARLAADVAGRLGIDDVPVVAAGPVLTTHVGLGSVTVAVRRDR
jgi:fatty acid-binding protein DegV